MKRLAVSSLSLVLVAMATTLTTGCAVAVLGIGAGTATAAYVAGELTRTYESDYPEAIRACVDTLAGLKIPVVERAGDHRKTAIKARRPDGTPVAIGIERIEEKRAEIGVRTGHVGVWDHPASLQIHDMIGERLTRRPNKDLAALKIDSPPAEPPPKEPAPSDEPGLPKKRVASKTAAAGAAHQPPDPSPAVHGSFNQDLTLFFANGAVEVSTENTEKLDRVAALLLANPAAVASLHGYSDTRGRASQNLQLSVGRADAVKRYLIEKGCSADQVLVIGYGSARFLGSNDTEAGRRLNRRVEIELHNAP
jgi:outer membrane protein OmpA-like peptidoglycan-associated protein